MRSALIVASVASMIDQFNRPNIELLKRLGYEVRVACNFIEGSTCSGERVRQLMDELQSAGVALTQIDFARDITRVSQNLRAYRQLRQLLKRDRYDLIHCHSPIGGLLTRLAARGARRRGAKVLYTAHGFHFFKGAPLKNWLMYYPVEWLCAHWTDVLITINREDYERARRRLRAKRVEYVPGVGVDIQKFASGALSADARAEKRAQLGLNAGDRMLLSVGELNRNKNHEVVIRALAQIGTPRIKYFVCGEGPLREHLQGLATELHIAPAVQLLGFRSDVAELCQAADLFVHPSLREGLSVALMEAIASRTPVICSRIRGNVDLVPREESLFDPRDAGDVARKIALALLAGRSDGVEGNYANLQRYGLERVISRMEELYAQCGADGVGDTSRAAGISRGGGTVP